MAFGRLGSGGTGFGRLGSTGSGGGVTAPAGGAALLVGETNGFAADFTYATDAQRVAVKTAGTVVASTVDDFYQNAGTSPKMVYDSAGTLGWSPHNYALQSAMGRPGFLAPWTLQGATGTAGQADPLGGSEALQITVTNNALGLNIDQVITGLTVGVAYVGAVWLKGTLGQQIYLSADGNGTTQQLVTFTGAWQRATHTITALFTGVHFNLECYNRGGGAHLPNVTFSVWGGQYQRAPAASTTYISTTTAARIGLVVDYDPVTHAAKGLLCEPAATNLLAQSQDLSLITAEKGTVTINNQTGPDGALTADTFTEDTTTGTHNCFGNTAATANADYTVSRFIKMGTRRYATIGWSDGTNGAYGVYDLQSGVVGSSAAIGTGTRNSASMQALLNGWYRCILSGKHGGTTGYFTFGTANAATITPDAFGRQSFLGTGATLFMGHGQVEAGTVATSPIPTAGATVTRAADDYRAAPSSFPLPTTACSMLLFFEDHNVSIVSDYLSLSIGSFAQSYNFDTTGFAVRSAGAYSALIDPALRYGRWAGAASVNDFRAATNGTLCTPDTAGAMPVGVTTLALGGGLAGLVGVRANAHISRVVIVPRLWSNAELQAKST